MQYISMPYVVADRETIRVVTFLSSPHYFTKHKNFTVMKTVSNFPVVAVICIAFSGCGHTSESVTEARNLQPVQPGKTEVEKLQLGQMKAEYVFKNLQLYPIVANETFINN